MIGVSSFIDASILYGSDFETSRSIRTFKTESSGGSWDIMENRIYPM